MNSWVNISMVVLTLGSLLGCLWLMWWTAKRRSATEGDKTDHVWDGVEEYNNPMPRWWLGLFIITVVFALGYLIVYPGLGWYAGTQGWTQEGELKAEQDRAQVLLEARFADVATDDLVALSGNEQAMATAKNLFANNCSTCHGADARGARGFPNLTDRDWLWGGNPETIYESIAHGRKGVMPAWAAVLGKQGVEEVSAYVMHLSGRKAPKDWVQAGKARFDTICAACHGPNGGGTQAMGAPNLTDQTWLYSGTLPAIRTAIIEGRGNEMPPHLDTLGELKVRLLAAYVYGLSHDDAERSRRTRDQHEQRDSRSTARDRGAADNTDERKSDQS